MRALRAPVLVMGLVLLVCSVTHSDARPNQINKYEKTWVRRMMVVLRKMGNGVGDGCAHANSHKLQTETGEPILEIFPRDLRRKKKSTEMTLGELRRKEKIIKHLTGPLYFSPKCRKHVYRLYHNTRDCTVPAYYRRCAGLLTRLSQRCQDS